VDRRRDARIDADCLLHATVLAGSRLSQITDICKLI
jgi:hypothetical protein